MPRSSVWAVALFSPSRATAWTICLTICRSSAHRPTRAAARTAGTKIAPNNDAISSMTAARVIAAITINMILPFWMSAAAFFVALRNSSAPWAISVRLAA